MIDFRRKVTPESICEDSQLLWHLLHNNLMSMCGPPGMVGCDGGVCRYSTHSEKDHKDIHYLESAIHALQEVLDKKFLIDPKMANPTCCHGVI